MTEVIMYGFKDSVTLREEKKGSFRKGFEDMTEVERLEFEIDWIYAEIERLEKESRKVRLKLAELKGERCCSCRTPLTRKEEGKNS
jgi:hypothetical protein